MKLDTVRIVAAEPDAKKADAGEKTAEADKEPDKEANAKEPGKADAVRAARSAK